MKRNGIMGNRVISAVLAAAVTLAASWIAYIADIPNPVIILVVIMIFFTAMVSNAAGAASGICIILYALFFFSDHHSFFHFKETGLYKCRIIVISLIIIYAMVAIIRRRTEKAYEKELVLNEKLEKQNEILKRESDHDVLTGLYNRRGGDRRISEWITEAEGDASGSGRAVLATIDIDNFKDVNDIYGHGAGDEALRSFSRELEENFPEQSIFIRTGGDEFQVFLHGRDIFNMERKLKKFACKNFRFTKENRELTFHISCGYALYPAQARTRKELSSKSDVALYTAKANGKHQAILYSADNDGSVQGLVNFSTRNVTENLPVAFLVYRADETEKILAVSNTFLELCECSDFGEFQEYTGGTFHGFVSPDDLDRVEKSIQKQIEENRHGLDMVEYRIRTKTGRILELCDLGRIVRDPDLGDLFYVVVYDKNRLNTDID